MKFMDAMGGRADGVEALQALHAAGHVHAVLWRADGRIVGGIVAEERQANGVKLLVILAGFSRGKLGESQHGMNVIEEWARLMKCSEIEAVSTHRLDMLWKGFEAVQTVYRKKV